MKRTLKLALGVVMAAGLMVPAMAQDNFPDSPDNHWAYEALARMKKEGLLVGYPDGLFRGGRPASRYEMAVALHALFLRIKDLTDSLDTQVKSVNDKIAGMPKATNNTGDLDSLRATLNGLQSDVNGMKGWGQNITDLKRMAEEFKGELTGLNVNVKDLKDGLGKLETRVAALEKNKPTVAISGDINLFVVGSTSDKAGMVAIDKDGRTGQAGGITDNFSVLHEAGITLKGTNEEGPKWWGTIVFANTLETFDGLNSQNSGSYFEGESDNYISRLGISFDLGGFAAAKAGRLGIKVSPYIFQRPDYTTYYSNSRWDNGEFTIDGAQVAFKLGGANVGVFGGKVSDRLTTNGMSLNDINIQGLNIDRVLGVTAGLPIGEKGSVDLAYLWLDSDGTQNIGTFNTPNLVNRVNVYGGSAKFGFGAFDVHAGYSATTKNLNTDTKIDSDNTAWWASVGTKVGPVDLMGGYREVETNFMAPGDWGRIGLDRNPTNIKGFHVGGEVGLSSALKLSAKGGFYQAKDEAMGGTLNGTDTKADKYSVNLNYTLNENLNLMLGYENTKFKRTGADPEFTWTTIGLGYNIGGGGMLKIAYELSDVKNAFRSSEGTDFKGGFLTTQLGIKF